MKYFILVLIVLSFSKAEVKKTYYPNGILKNITPYNKNGEREGIAKTYYNNKNIAFEIPLKE